MAKSGKSGRRVLPSTPAPAGDGADARDPSHAAAYPADSAALKEGPQPRRTDRDEAAEDAPGGRVEPEYLIRGTGCVAGHERGHELDAGRLGRLPTKTATRVGFSLVLWCALGIGFLVDTRWLGLGIQLLVIWLAFSAVVQRRAGHRGKCWRTRTWRHAWGGLAPSNSDPTRPA